MGGVVHADADTSGNYAPTVTIHENSDVGNDGKSRHKDSFNIPPIIPPIGMNLDYEVTQREKGIHEERGGGKCEELIRKR
jgi:hypothetical protein